MLYILNFNNIRSLTIAKFTRLNNQIQAHELRVIDENGNQLGILSKQEALDIAKSKDLDLIEVSPDAQPPVARIIDWGKYNYQKSKKTQKSRKSTKTSELKQIRMGLKIDDNDLYIKLKKVDQFLAKGHKVRISLVFRGREQAHKEIGFDLAQRIINEYSEKAKLEQQPILAGKQLSFVLSKIN